MAIQVEFTDVRGVHYAEAYVRIQTYQTNYRGGTVEIIATYWRDVAAAETTSGFVAVKSEEFIAPLAEVNALYQTNDPPDPRVTLYRWLMGQAAFAGGLAV
jgi:hypothetical protein